MSESITEIQIEQIPEDFVCPACDKAINKQELNLTAFVDYISIPLPNGDNLTVLGTYHAECLDKYTCKVESLNLIKPEFLLVAVQKLAAIGGV